mgnify:CR=1 FL=1
MSESLILAGGGAKGAYQAHVAAHVYENRKIDSIFGVSAGALNGSVLAQGKTNRIREIWRETRKSDVWAIGLWRLIGILTGRNRGFYSPEPLLDLVTEEFDPSNLEVPLLAGATNLRTSGYETVRLSPKESYSEEEKLRLRRFVVASSAVPVGVEPVEIGGELYGDGGIRNVAPIGSSIEENPDRITVILNSRLHPTGDHTPSSIIEYGKWALETALNETVREDVSTARKVNRIVSETGPAAGYTKADIRIIEPPEPLGSAADFSKEAARRRIEIANRQIRNDL